MCIFFLSLGLSDLHSMRPEEFFEEHKFLKKTFNLFWTLSEKDCDFFLFIGEFVRTAFFMSRGTFWDRELFYYIFQWLTEKVPVYWRKKFKKIVDKALLLPKRTIRRSCFERKIQKVSENERNILDVKRIFFDMFVKTAFFLSSRQNRTVTFLIIFGPYAKMFRPSGTNVWTGLSKLHSSISAEHFEGDFTFWNKNVFFSSSGIGRKLLRFICKTVGPELSQLPSRWPEGHFEQRLFC